LINNGIKLTKVIHNPGEFMITRAAGYHSGFNFGYNLAEAVNFALPYWLDIAQNVKCCTCTDSTV
jgi:DNA damage-responsive transcriptional repressor / [histone H3]-trimethyl-L-lysine36 demethylase